MDAALNMLLGDPVGHVRPICSASEPAALLALRVLGSPIGAPRAVLPDTCVRCQPCRDALPSSFPGDPTTLVGTSFPLK